jgi:hypothetical protein
VRGWSVIWQVIRMHGDAMAAIDRVAVHEQIPTAMGADLRQRFAESVAKPRIPKFASGDFSINPASGIGTRLGVPPAVRSHNTKPMEHPSIANQVLSDVSQAILSVQDFANGLLPPRKRNCR